MKSLDKKQNKKIDALAS
jgi:translation elongation factor EF-Ts